MSEETPQHDELKRLIESNARAIQAITDALARERQEREQSQAEALRDRQTLYRSLSSYMQSNSELQGLMYRLLSDMETRQHELSQRQEELSQCQGELSQRQEEIAQLQVELSRNQTNIVEILKLLTQNQKSDRDSA